MCNRHAFNFDADKAYEDQLVSVLDASPDHPLTAPEAPQQLGIYVLFRKGLPVYVGQAVKLRGRLSDHRKKIENRQGISAGEVTCRFLTIRTMWEVARAEAALIQRYKPEWNGIPGFSMHIPGIGRPGKPGYVNEWDKRFPPRKK